MITPPGAKYAEWADFSNVFSSPIFLGHITKMYAYDVDEALYQIFQIHGPLIWVQGLFAVSMWPYSEHISNLL